MEMWKPIKQLEGRYEVSNRGNVRRVGHFDPRGAWHGPRPIKATINRSLGYPMIYPKINGKTLGLYVHRLVAEEFIEQKDGAQHVNHIDGVKANNDVSNLEWVTPAENAAHAHRIGLFPPSKIGPGERSPAAKLNDQKVSRIKALLNAGESIPKLAKEFSVCDSTIRWIKQGVTWAHVEAV